MSASATAAKQSLAASQASWDALADVGDLLLPGVVAAAMAFAGTESSTSCLSPRTSPRPRSSDRVSCAIWAPARDPLYARTIVCPPINLFMCSYTYAGIIDFSITTIEQLCPDPEALAEGLEANSIGS